MARLVVNQRTVERVGVGEVFVIAGQSNSANYGNPTLSAADDRVSTFNLSNWRHADDPLADRDGIGRFALASFGRLAGG